MYLTTARAKRGLQLRAIVPTEECALVDVTGLATATKPSMTADIVVNGTTTLRVTYAGGKANGHPALSPADLDSPIYGSFGRDFAAVRAYMRTLADALRVTVANDAQTYRNQGCPEFLISGLTLDEEMNLEKIERLLPVPLVFPNITLGQPLQLIVPSGYNDWADLMGLGITIPGKLPLGTVTQISADDGYAL